MPSSTRHSTCSSTSSPESPQPPLVHVPGCAGGIAVWLMHGLQVHTVERAQEGEPNAEGKAGGKARQARGAEGSSAKLELEVIIVM